MKANVTLSREMIVWKFYSQIVNILKNAFNLFPILFNCSFCSKGPNTYIYLYKMQPRWNKISKLDDLLLLFLSFCATAMV